MTDSLNKNIPLLVDWKTFSQGPASANVNDNNNNNTTKATLLADTHSELGEGIVYDDQRQEIVWCDILDRKFHRLSLTTTTADDEGKIIIGGVETYALSKMLGSFALLDDKSKTNNSSYSKYEGAYLFAWEDGFQLFNPTTQAALSEYSVGEDVNPKKLPTRLNDGRCDLSGKRFICGGYYGDIEGVTMKVYCCQLLESESNNNNNNNNKLVHTPLMENISVTNSLAFAPNNGNAKNIMYFTDSPTKEIVAYDYNVDATDTASLLSNKRSVYKVELEGAVPDGSCVDADGYVWSATWWNGMQSSRVRRIDPTSGKVVFEVHMPDGTSRVSCCCFGGPDLNILFMTTAAEGSDATKEPHAGGLYAIKLEGVKGKLEHRFQV